MLDTRQISVNITVILFSFQGWWWSPVGQNYEESLQKASGNVQLNDFQHFFFCFNTYRKIYMKNACWCCCLAAELCLTLCDPMDSNLSGSSVHEIFQERILEWVAISFSRGSFPTQGLNPGLLHCRQILYRLSYKGSPYMISLQQTLVSTVKN